MNTNLLTIAAQLSDDALDAKLKFLAQGSRQTTVELIAHLAEFATRKLHRAQGPGRLFGYCTQILRFSEAAAWNRIKAAKAARKFPVILDLLSDGSVNLTTIRLLAPHLTEENHMALLAEATGMTRRQVDKVVARLAPKPDVPASIRKLPAARANVPGTGAVTSVTPARDEQEATTCLRPQPTTHRPVVAPLSPERYRMQLTIGEEAHDDLRCLQDLMRREIPNGDPAVIVARALRRLRQEVEKKAFAATSKPRPGRTPTPGSRHIPANVERTVWQRDGGRCAFVAKNGRRCTERSYIEFHHQSPHAVGGEPTVDNISLRCREHNEYESELIFGPYDPSCVREAPAVYGRSMGSLLVPGPVTPGHESAVSKRQPVRPRLGWREHAESQSCRRKPRLLRRLGSSSVGSTGGDVGHFLPYGLGGSLPCCQTDPLPSGVSSVLDGGRALVPRPGYRPRNPLRLREFVCAHPVAPFLLSRRGSGRRKSRRRERRAAP